MDYENAASSTKNVDSEQPKRTSYYPNSYGAQLTELPNLITTPPELIDMKDVRHEKEIFMIQPFKYNPNSPNCEPVPIHGLRNYKDFCTSDSVLMPCASQNVDKNQIRRWPHIKTTLTYLKTKCESSTATTGHIKKALEKIHEVSFDIGCLEQIINQAFTADERHYFMNRTLPNMISLALDIDNICSQPLPLLLIGSNRSVTMSQKQAGSILACAFFCLFPDQNKKQERNNTETFGCLNFIYLLRSGSVWKVEKLKCILQYFRRITDSMPTGVLSFQRYMLPNDSIPKWMASKKPLSTLHVASGTAIEEMHGFLQVDFANEFIGGGVMDEGIVQEEIRFTVCPEMLVSILFCEVMQANECIHLIGCEQFTTYNGYATTFKFQGDYHDRTPKDSWGRKLCHVVAMDALYFQDRRIQSMVESIGRELVKAYTSFRIPDMLQNSMFGIATGHWGCGAFNGDRELKAIIQMAAASEAGRPLIYTSWHDANFSALLWTVYAWLSSQDATVQDLCFYLEKFSKTSQQISMFEFILSAPLTEIRHSQ